MRQRKGVIRTVTGWVYDDGGRQAAGFRGQAGDCVTRAIAIATGLPYRQVYDELHARGRAAIDQRRLDYDGGRRRASREASPRDGVKPKIYRAYLESLGWTWVPTMAIGSGTQVHLQDGELPAGRIIARVSRHLCAVIDGIIHDTHDPSRDGTRCVYGYWTREE